MTDYDHTLEYLCGRGLAPATDSLLIIGNGPTQPQGYAIAESEGIDAWGVNVPHHSLKALFNMHPRHIIEDRMIAKYGIDSHKNAGFAFVSLDEHPDLSDNPVRYPLARMIAEYNTRYFANGLAYMIPLAMYMGYTRLMLYGVDYNVAHYPESVFSRPCLEWWLGRAIERGITPHFPRESHLMTGYIMPRSMYGYEIYDPQLSTEEIERRYA